jgi:thiol-disulfide isomerase/thioredoxin
MFNTAIRKIWPVLATASGIIALLVAAVWLILFFGDRHPMRDRQADGDVAARSESGTLILHNAPRQLPEVVFQDDSGAELSLADFKGRFLLLNLWATWCVPCREEMPTLDSLQAKLGGDDFEVVALSVDRAGMPVVRSFYREIGISHLALYIDSSMKASFALAVGLPTTMLIDRKGREIGRLVGPARWDSPEMIETIQSLMADGE